MTGKVKRLADTLRCGRLSVGAASWPEASAGMAAHPGHLERAGLELPCLTCPGMEAHVAALHWPSHRPVRTGLPVGPVAVRDSGPGECLGTLLSELAKWPEQVAGDTLPPTR